MLLSMAVLLTILRHPCSLRIVKLAVINLRWLCIHFHLAVRVLMHELVGLVGKLPLQLCIAELLLSFSLRWLE